MQLPGSGAQAQELWPMGSVALQHVGSSQIRDRTCVFCTDMWVIHHRARGDPHNLFLSTQCVTHYVSGPVGDGQSEESGGSCPDGVSVTKH